MSTVLLQYRLLEQAFGLHSNGYYQGCCAFHFHGARGGQCKRMDELLRRLPTSEWKLVYRSLLLHSYLHCRYIIRSKPIMYSPLISCSPLSDMRSHREQI